MYDRFLIGLHRQLSWVVGYDTPNFVLMQHQLPVLSFLSNYLINSQKLRTSLLNAYSGTTAALAGTSAVFIELDEEKEIVQRALSWCPPTRRPFGILAPQCACGVDPVNMRVLDHSSSTPRFKCFACKAKTLPFYKPEWSEAVSTYNWLVVTPFPIPEFHDDKMIKKVEGTLKQPGRPSKRKHSESRGPRKKRAMAKEGEADNAKVNDAKGKGEGEEEEEEEEEDD
jgi:hypothetical protein